LAKNLSLPKRFSTSQSAQLALLAGLSGLIYLLVFTLPFPLHGLYQTIPPVDYTKLTHYSRSGFIAYVVSLAALFALYIGAIRLTMPVGAGEWATRGTREKTELFSFIFIASAILAGILIFSYPVTAIDLFIYAIRTRGWALYGLNPLATPPEALPAADPWLGLAAEWLDAPSPYGPLWEWLSLGAFHLSGGDFLSHLLALKIISALAYLGCVWLVYRILQQLQPRWAITSAIAFAWNPLTLLESIQNGHNDIVMTFFLLAAIWTLEEAMRRRSEEVKDSSNLPSLLPTPYSLLLILLLVLSILVKFVTILLVPFFLLAITGYAATWARRLVLLIGYGLLIAVLVILPMLPLWPGWDNWAVLQAGSGAGRSLLALLILTLRDAWGINSSAFDFSNKLLLGIYGLIYLYFLWQMVKGGRESGVGSRGAVVSSQKSVISNPTFQPSNLPTFQPSFHVLFWYVLLAAPVFHAWYLLWFLPLASLLLPHKRPLTAAIVFSITALFIIPYFETIRVWYPALLQNHFLGHLIGVPLLLIPPALALFWPISPRAKSEV
jgi:hypothetical protein